MKDATRNLRQLEFKERMRKNGFAQVTEWVPVDSKTHFKDLARGMRLTHLSAQ